MKCLFSIYVRVRAHCSADKPSHNLAKMCARQQWQLEAIPAMSLANRLTRPKANRATRPTPVLQTLAAHTTSSNNTSLCVAKWQPYLSCREYRWRCRCDGRADDWRCWRLWPPFCHPVTCTWHSAECLRRRRRRRRHHHHHPPAARRVPWARLSHAGRLRHWRVVSPAGSSSRPWWPRTLTQGARYQPRWRSTPWLRATRTCSGESLQRETHNECGIRSVSVALSVTQCLSPCQWGRQTYPHQNELHPLSVAMNTALLMHPLSPRSSCHMACSATVSHTRVSRTSFAWRLATARLVHEPGDRVGLRQCWQLQLHTSNGRVKQETEEGQLICHQQQSKNENGRAVTFVAVCKTKTDAETIMSDVKAEMEREALLMLLASGTAEHFTRVPFPDSRRVTTHRQH